jgi:hypothetical protein
MLSSSSCRAAWSCARFGWLLRFASVGRHLLAGSLDRDTDVLESVDDADWFRHRATEMDITMIGLQNAGKTSLLRVLAVSSIPNCMSILRIS